MSEASPNPGSAPPERILLVHNRYQQRGGEDAVFATERALLERHGHHVETLVVDNASIPERRGAAGRVRLARDTIWSPRAYQAVARRLEDARIDVLHAHNTFPLLSPAVHVAARRSGSASVQTLHNYRLACPAATLYRDGAPCTDCSGRLVAWPGVVHACYRGSRAATAAVAASLAFHRLRGTWVRDVGAFIVLTRFMRDVLVRSGLPAERVVVKANTLADEPAAADGSVGADGVLFVGRLAEEKGVRTLCDAAAALGARVPVTVAGTGPLEAEVRRAADAGHLRWVGSLDTAAVHQAMRDARALVVPSVWYEGMPLVVLEAFAVGRPVIASRIGSPAELVEDGRTGILVEPGNAGALAQAIRWVEDHPADAARMGETAARVYAERFAPEQNYRSLMEVYAQAASRVAPR